MTKSYVNKIQGVLNGIEDLHQTTYNSLIYIKTLALSFTSLSILYPIPKSFPNISYAKTWSLLIAFTPLYTLPFYL